MAKYTLLFFTNAKDGRDAEFNDWYSHRHLKDVLAVPGFKSAQRFRLDKALVDGGPAVGRYLAIYEVETDNLDAVLAELNARVGTDRMPITDAIATDQPAAQLVCIPLTEKITA